MNNWQSIESAPKNKTILLDVGLPWAVVGIWNEPANKFVYANQQCDLFLGKWDDTYFENEHAEIPKRWQPMPEIE